MNGNWARIESVSDSLGHHIHGLETVETSEVTCATNRIIRVGDQVVFTCKAIDPLARPVVWEISYSSKNSIPDGGLGQPVSLSGDEVEFRWVVAEEQVGLGTWVQIKMASAGADHRWPEGWDGCVSFLYAVVSPGTK